MKNNLSDFDINREKAIREEKGASKNFSLTPILGSVDIKRDSQIDKKKAMIVYKMLKGAIPVTAVSFCAVLGYAAVSGDLSDIGIKSNGASISISSAFKTPASLSSLAADENVNFFGEEYSSKTDVKDPQEPTMDKSTARIGTSDLVGKLKELSKGRKGKSAFFILSDNSVIFPITKDKSGNVFSDSQVKTYLESVGVSPGNVYLQSFPNTYIDAIAKIETSDISSRDNLVQILKKNFYTKDGKVLISKDAFGPDYSHYESIMNEITEVSNKVIQVR